jgi:CHAT domain-containing protein/Tfp pilus assembly protein PilF
MAVTYGDMGDYRRAIELENQAIALHRLAGNRSGEAIAINNIGTAYSNLGEYQKAMDAHTAAFNIAHEQESFVNEAVDLNNIAQVYSIVGDKENALKYYNQSVEICRKVDDRWHLAQSLTNLGGAYTDLQNYDQALKIFNEALALHRTNANRTGEGSTLKSLAAAYWKLGDREKALDYDRQAVAILRVTQDRRLLAQALENMGSISRETGELERAMEYLNEASQISVPIGDRRGQAESLGEIAHVELDRGDFKEAQKHSDQALAIFDSLRSTITNPKLRAWFSQAVRKVHEVNLQALFRLHQQQPTAGYGAAALLAAEKGRAQSLLELLGESQARIREGIDPVLLDRELSLRKTIAGKAQLQERLLAGMHSDAQVAAAAKELDLLTRDYDQLQSSIREKSPEYAALTMPVPLGLAEIQHDVLDSETLLLEYALGEEKSVLFVVTPTSLCSFELPERKTIEAAAKKVYDLLSVQRQAVPGETLQQRITRLRRAEAEYPAAAARLSQMLLGPVAKQLGGKRLLIVAEGVLQYVPFNALPEPQEKASPKPRLLIDGHEIVTAPSASVLSLIRHDAAQRRPADKQLAVLADPVFDGQDSRVKRGEKTPADSSAPTSTGGDVLRSAAESGFLKFVRLRFSRQEAQRIARFADSSRELTALDFGASRATALSSELGQYRIVHFATHGLINNQHPELSGLVLSLVNEQGQEVDGFLRLYDIYNLRLGADLVVLSACRTALGKEIAGEGLIGLTRGFVYAGVPRVVASLWQVDDRATAELMENFYQAMLTRNERPAAALRSAQLAISQTKGWESPFYWAAFTLQGEWR